MYIMTPAVAGCILPKFLLEVTLFRSSHRLNFVDFHQERKACVTAEEQFLSSALFSFVFIFIDCSVLLSGDLLSSLSLSESRNLLSLLNLLTVV